MKKLLFVLMLFLVVGCSNASSKSIGEKDIKGYWLQIKEDWSEDITDLTDNPYAYLEVTDDNLYFYTISFNEDEGYGVSTKYYKLENNIIYYDYYELKGDAWKENINEYYGGEFNVSIVNNNLVLLEYINGKDKEDGYKENTYIKIGAEDWPIED